MLKGDMPEGGKGGQAAVRVGERAPMYRPNRGDFVMDSLRLSRLGYAVFALVKGGEEDYLPDCNKPPTQAPNDGPRRSEVAAMKLIFGLFDAGVVATIAFGVFAATSDIFSFSILAL